MGRHGEVVAQLQRRTACWADRALLVQGRLKAACLGRLGGAPGSMGLKALERQALPPQASKCVR